MSKLTESVYKVFVSHGLTRHDINGITEQGTDVLVKLHEMPIGPDNKIHRARKGENFYVLVNALYDARAIQRYEIALGGNGDGYSIGGEFDRGGIVSRGVDLTLKGVDAAIITGLSHAASTKMHAESLVALQQIVQALGITGKPEFARGVLFVPDFSIAGEDRTGHDTSTDFITVFNKQAPRIVERGGRNVYSMKISAAPARRLQNSEDQKFGIEIATDELDSEFVSQMMRQARKYMVREALKKGLPKGFSGHTTVPDYILPRTDEFEVFIYAYSSPIELRRFERLQLADLMGKLQDRDIEAELKMEEDKPQPWRAPGAEETVANPGREREGVRLNKEENPHATLKVPVTFESFRQLSQLIKQELGRTRG